MTQPSPPPPPRSGVPVYALPTDPASSADPRARKPPVLHWSAAIAAILFVAIAIWRKRADAVAEATEPQYWLPYLAGSIVGALLFSVLLAYVVYRAARRSTVGGTVTFCVFIALSIGLTFKPSRSLVQKVQTTSNALLDELGGKLLTAQASLDQAKEAGALTGPDVDRPGVLAKRLETLDETLRLNDDFIKAADDAPAELDRRLQAQHISATLREAAVRDFAQRFPWDYGRKVHTTRGRVLSGAREILVLLRDHPRDWEYDAKENRVNFSRQETLDAFAELQAKLNKAVEEERTTLREKPVP